MVKKYLCAFANCWSFYLNNLSATPVGRKCRNSGEFAHILVKYSGEKLIFSKHLSTANKRFFQ